MCVVRCIDYEAACPVSAPLTACPLSNLAAAAGGLSWPARADEVTNSELELGQESCFCLVYGSTFSLGDQEAAGWEGKLLFAGLKFATKRSYT